MKNYSLSLFIGFFIVFSFSFNSVSAQKITKAKKLKLQSNGLVYSRKDQSPFTGIAEFDFSAMIGLLPENYMFNYYLVLGEKLDVIYNVRGELSFKDGKLNGLTVFWRNKTNLLSEVNFKNGELDGVCNVFYKNGSKAFKGSYKNGKKEGLHIIWDVNGNWTSILNYNADKEIFIKKSDLSQEIMNMLTPKTAINTYRSDQVFYKNTSILVSGIHQDYAKNGKLISESNYTNGQRDGLLKEWYSNGNQKFEGSYTNGKREGLHIIWDEDGNWTSIRNYNAGKETFIKKADLSQKIMNMLTPKTAINTYRSDQVFYKNTSILVSGIHQDYAKNGKLISESNYTNGQRDGLLKEWYSNGNQKFEGSYTNGKREGLHIFWDVNGNWTSIRNYNAGKETFIKKEDLSQELLDEMNIPLEVKFGDLIESGNIFYYRKFSSIVFSGEVKEFYPNGEIKYVYNFLNGNLVLIKWFFANGILAELANYEKGEFKIFHENGELRYDSENCVSNHDYYNENYAYQIYINSIANGWHKEYYENGQLFKQFRIKDSKIDSLYREWYSNGNQKFESNYINGIKYGPYKEWHSNGNQKLKCNYINGRKEGDFREWYNNGILRIQANYVNGEIDGLYKHWDSDGKNLTVYKYHSGARE